MSFRPKKSLENDKIDGFEGGLMGVLFYRRENLAWAGFAWGGRQAGG
jgi:hypothetical protein